MLIKHGRNRIVNLTNVSNIFFEDSRNRVIFNMNYSVKIFGGLSERIEIVEAKNLVKYMEDHECPMKTTSIVNVIKTAKYSPDYTYWSYDNDTEKQQIKELIEGKLKETSWIFPAIDSLRYVNLSCVSTINYDDYKNRIIFNLNYHVTHPNERDKLTSDYVFWDFDNDTEKFNHVKENFEFLVGKI